MKPSTLAVVTALLLMQSGLTNAGQRDVSCSLAFSSTEWSAVYQRSQGTGVVSCSDGSKMPVQISAKGLGLTAGKWKVDHGVGKFTHVRSPKDVLGRYASVSGNVGLFKTGDVEVASKGRVSLALAGHGDGFDLGIAINEFQISAPAASTKDGPGRK